MVSCQLFDYIEIACLYHFELELKVINNDIITGIAIDTTRNSDKQECLILQSKDQSKQLVELDHIISMQAITKNPHLDKIVFIDKE